VKSSQTFDDERSARIASYADNAGLRNASRAFLLETIRGQYSYNFDWLSRPVIQYPQDIVAMQELIWSVKPDLIIETGIAHGGSLILSASILALLDYCEAIDKNIVLDPRASKRRVVGIDIDIRSQNRAAIEAHPLSAHIEMLQGSSIAPDLVSQVSEIAGKYQRVMVCLDSNHTHDHVLAELEAYAPLTSLGSYCCVFDTVVEDLPDELSAARPWGQGDNPKTAVREYLRNLEITPRKAADGRPLRFSINKAIELKLSITVAPDGYLRRIE
jgi:cephalosporin hydroxylase